MSSFYETPDGAVYKVVEGRGATMVAAAPGKVMPADSAARFLKEDSEEYSAFVDSILAPGSTGRRLNDREARAYSAIDLDVAPMGAPIPEVTDWLGSKRIDYGRERPTFMQQARTKLGEVADAAGRPGEGRAAAEAGGVAATVPGPSEPLLTPVELRAGVRGLGSVGNRSRPAPLVPVAPLFLSPAPGDLGLRWPTSAFFGDVGWASTLDTPGATASESASGLSAEAGATVPARERPNANAAARTRRPRLETDTGFLSNLQWRNIGRRTEPEVGYPG
jgi:hypothetical protein